MIKEVIILGRRIRIQNVSETEMIRQKAKETLRGEEEAVLGFYSMVDKTVYIWSGLEEDVYKETLLHELSHAMLDVSGLSQLLSSKQEEAFCTASESLLVLFQNKKFVELMND